MMLERSRQSHREGGSTPRRGTGASTPFHRPTPDRESPGKPGVDKKVGSAICRPLPVPASGISPPDFHRLVHQPPLRTRRRRTIPGVEALPFGIRGQSLFDARFQPQGSTLQFSKQRRAIDLEDPGGIAYGPLPLDRLPDNPLFDLLHPAF
jgi:hypothetical protein